MTDLKDLLDHAAGAEPGVTDADLSADLDRGRRAVRRRRATGIASGAVATALVIGVGWSVLPSGTTSDGLPQPAAHPTATPTPARPTGHVIGGSPTDHRPPAPVPAGPVPLVPNTKPFPGAITCDLIPKGWAVKLTVTPAQGGGWEQKMVYDPNLRNPQHYHDATYELRVRQSELRDNGEGLTADKYTTPWTKLPKVRVGQNEAVATALAGGRNGHQEVHVRQGSSNHMVVVSNMAYNLGWDMTTVLTFAGSCHYKK